jgi:hypothetical protein
MVPIAHYTALFTAIDAHRQRHHLSMPTVGACLCGVGRGHFDHLSLSFFRFSNKCAEKCAPGYYRFVQPSLAPCPALHILSRHFGQFGLRPFNQIAHDQGLDGDQPEALDQPVGLLLDEVLAPPSDTLMDSCYDLAPFASFWGAPLRFRETMLRFRQLFFFCSEKARGINLFTSGEEGKGLESDIDADVLSRWGQSDRIDLIAREAHKPLARRVSDDTARFDDAFEGPVLDHLEMPNLGKGELALFIDAETRLGVGEGIVAEPGFIAWIARLKYSFHALEEGFEGFVDAMQHILQDLGVDGFIFWSERFDGGKLSTLLREGDAETAHPIGVFALLQCGVVQLRAESELLMQQALLLLGWVQTVLIGFLHTYVFFLGREKGKCPTRTAAFILIFESRSFQR